MIQRTIFVNPGHGNSPYIYSTLIAFKILEKLSNSGDIKILVPWIYGERQEYILKGIAPNMERVILDSKLGEISKKITFRDDDFSKHIDRVSQLRTEVEKEAREYVKNRYGNPILEINAGSKFTLGVPAVYAFPVSMSTLLKYTLKEPALKGMCNDKVQRVYEMLVKVEENFDLEFIPLYNSFSFDKKRIKKSNEISTPPLASKPKKDTKSLPKGSIYCMPSGTGSQIKQTIEIARRLQKEGKHVLVPSWVEEEGFDKINNKQGPNIFSNDNLTKVIARAGFGTIWDCQISETSFEPIPYSYPDDPEIYFNNKTLEAIPIKEGTEMQKKEFGGDMDGIDFVADKIVKHFKFFRI